MTTAYSTRIHGIMEREMGDIGKFIVKKRCTELGIPHEAIAKQDLPQVARSLSEAMVNLMGRERAASLYREITKAYDLDSVPAAESDPTKKRQHFLDLGDSARNVGEYDSASKYYTKFIESATASKNEPDVILAHIRFGALLNLTNKPMDAIGRFTIALKAAERLDLKREQCEAWRGLGYAYWRLGECKEAIASYGKAEKLIGPESPKGLKGTTDIEIGLVHQSLGESKKALQRYEAAIPLLKEANDWVGVARANNNIGETHKESGSLHKAIESYQECKAAGKKAGSQVMIGMGLGNSAECFARLGNAAEARKRADMTLEIFNKINDHYMISGVYLTRALADITDRRWVSMKKNFATAITMLEDLNFPYEIATNTMEYARGLRKKGELLSAEEQYRKAMKIFAKVGNDCMAKKARDELESL